MQFVVLMEKFGSQEEKFRDADSETHTFVTQPDLLRFLVKTDFSDWDKVTIIEKSIAEIKF